MPPAGLVAAATGPAAARYTRVTHKGAVLCDSTYGGGAWRSTGKEVADENGFEDTWDHGTGTTELL